jgi:hypothetical protein
LHEPIEAEAATTAENPALAFFISDFIMSLCLSANHKAKTFVILTDAIVPYIFIIFFTTDD